MDGATRPVVLVGFMGAGKSAVGEHLAARLGWALSDTDAMLAVAHGCTAGELLARVGEAAFRAHERAAVDAALAAPGPRVIATGGGTLTDPEARRALLAGGWCVHLAASAATLWQRLARGGAPRPLLGSPPDAGRHAALLAARAPLYAAADWQLATDGREAAAVGEAIAARVADGAHRGRAVAVAAAAGPYTVEFVARGGPALAAFMQRWPRGGRIAVIADARVAARHGAAVMAAVGSAGHAVSVHLVPPGEASKSLAQAQALLAALAAARLDRHDLVVALGGGVVGDLAGFVASVYLRGVAWLQVPTTTQAAVDASVGGKTAVNLPAGKNLVGSFHAPRGVIVARDLWGTQADSDHRSGLAEVLKMAATHDAPLFTDVTDTAAAVLAGGDAAELAMCRGVRIKAGVVARDEREAGERAVLNFGHTVGHAIEVGEAYAIAHGEAVARGMLAEAEFAVGAGLTDVTALEALRRGLAALKLPSGWRDVKLDAAAMEIDKKRRGDGIVLPTMRQLGAWQLHEVPLAALARFLAQKESA